MDVTKDSCMLIVSLKVMFFCDRCMHPVKAVYMRVCLQPESGLTVIQLEKQLRLCVETLNKDKQERLRAMKSRMKVDQHLCDALNAIPYYIPTGSVPSDHQLDELEQHIRDLEAEQVMSNFTEVSTLSCLIDSVIASVDL